MNTNIDTSSLEYFMKESLKQEVKKHLIDMIDNHLEKISRDAVDRFLSFEISKSYEAGTMADNIYFSFVNKITKTVIKEVVIQEQDRA